MNARRILLELFDAALRAVDGRACVDALSARRRRCQARSRYSPSARRRAPWRCGAHDALGAAHRAHAGHHEGRPRAIPSSTRLPGVCSCESAHPVPDARSLAAGAELERRVSRPARGRLAVVPDLGWQLEPGRSAARRRLARRAARAQRARAGRAAGTSRRLNAERARLSRLKGGGIARLLAGGRALALFISDVPGDDPGRDRLRVVRPRRRQRRCASSGIVVANVETAVRAVRDGGAAHGLDARSRARALRRRCRRASRREFVAALRATASATASCGAANRR